MKKLVFLFLLFASVASAQNVKNPSSLLFTVSVDHVTLTSYEVDIKRTSDGGVVSTFNIGKPAPSVDNIASVNIQPNVMGLSFGTYYVVVRAVAGTLRSVDSNNSNNLDRVPGPPSGSKVQ